MHDFEKLVFATPEDAERGVELINAVLENTKRETIAEMSKSQSSETCAKGHPRWALREEEREHRFDPSIKATFHVCSTCAELSTVEREQDGLKELLKKYAMHFDNCLNSDACICGLAKGIPMARKA